MAASDTANNNKPPDGSCALDVRVLILGIIFSMAGAFFAGVSFVPPPALVEFLASVTKPSVKQQTPQFLELSRADLFTSLEHSPSGQHLLVDIEGIEAAFLDSEERISAAMVQTVQEAGLTMLSYHCHKLMPAGISCVGVLMESHISFHTWPEEGVITLDLFTCGPNPLLPVVPVIERLFGIGDNTNTKWAHELRGFRSMEEKKKNYLDNLSDLSLWILSPIEMNSKKMIYSNMTKFQRVDIWDVSEPEITPSYEDGLRQGFEDGDPRWLDPAYASPDRLLFLDGTLQNVRSLESNYHEALVHPAMFAHPGPVSVGIIGGGEGAALREVLKHKTVQKITMIEIDEEIIQIVQEHLPKMSDCSQLVGRADNCFEDEIVDIVHENGLQWFKDRYSAEATLAPPDKSFDVVLVDALDPQDGVPFNSDLEGATGTFVSSIMKSLSDNGVIVIAIGIAAELSDPKANVGTDDVRETLFNLFEGHPDVASMHVYEEPHSGWLEPQSFLIVCKHASCRSRWYARSDIIDWAIYERIAKTSNGERALRAYDGATQHTYQYPAMSWEAVYCRREPTPFECAYRQLDFSKDVYEFDMHEDSKSSFTVVVKKNDAGEVTGSSVVAKVDIPKGSYIMPDQLAKSMTVFDESAERAKRNFEAPLFTDFSEFTAEHSHPSLTKGSKASILEVGATVLIRKVNNDAEANIGRWVPPHPIGKRPAYSPVYDRHRTSFDVFMVATQEIKAGEELTRFKDMWAGEA